MEPAHAALAHVGSAAHLRSGGFRGDNAVYEICIRTLHLLVISFMMTGVMRLSYNEGAVSIPRTETLQPHPQRHQSIKQIPLVITYHPALSRITKTLRKHLDILHVSDRLKAAIPDPPIVAFRCPHNLRDLLVRAKLKETNPPTQTGNHPCNSTRCKTCHMIRIEETFKSHSTGTTHKTRSTFTCKTRNLVYLI